MAPGESMTDGKKVLIFERPDRGKTAAEPSFQVLAERLDQFWTKALSKLKDHIESAEQGN